MCWLCTLDCWSSVYVRLLVVVCCFVKQKTAYEMRISDWSSDVCSSDLHVDGAEQQLVDADCAADDGEVLAAPAVDDALELRCAQMGQLREQQLEERQIAPAQGLPDGIGDRKSVV